MSDGPLMGRHGVNSVRTAPRMSIARGQVTGDTRSIANWAPLSRLCAPLRHLLMYIVYRLVNGARGWLLLTEARDDN